jgi:hypothetical protein
MTVGETVFVAIPICLSVYSDEPGGRVYQGTVIASGDRGEVVVKTDGGIHTYGGPFSDTKAFGSESEAWRHCAAVLRRRGQAVLDAAAGCEAKA